MAIAIVTGASSGIGEAIAREMAAMGFAVALGARRVERLVECGVLVVQEHEVLPRRRVDLRGVNRGVKRKV